MNPSASSPPPRKPFVPRSRVNDAPAPEALAEAVLTQPPPTLAEPPQAAAAAPAEPVKQSAPTETIVEAAPAAGPSTISDAASSAVPNLSALLDRFPVSWPIALGCGALIAAFLWAYWPTFANLAHVWNAVPDYSHGYFVIPLAALFLWLRRSSMPPLAGPGWGGLALIGMAFAMHFVGSYYYLDALHGWSIPLWCAGVAWLFGGWKFCAWCLPALGFLLFMVPLPARFEGMLSLPLQRISTEVSCWTLQSLGLPALAEGNVIMIDDVRLEVARACSGLRIFVSIVALAYAYMVLVRKPWWIKALIFSSVIPIAVVANSVRVTLVGVAYPQVETPAARHLAHDVAGWLVIPLAAALMGAFVWYLGKLFMQVRPLSQAELLRR